MHNEDCLLYESGELGAREAEAFERHLPDCLECLQHLETIRRSHAWAQQAAAVPAAALLALASGRGPSAPPASGTGNGSTGLLKLLALSALLGGTGYAIYTARQPAPPADDTPPQPAFELAMPSAAGRPRPHMRGETGDLGPERTSPPLQAAREPGEPPKVPLDCASAGSIGAFKDYVLWGWHTPSYADEWAAAVCGEGASRVRPSIAVPDKTWTNISPSCPAAARSGDREKDVEAYWSGILPTAKVFHEMLPLSKAQALRLAEGYCGGRPPWVDASPGEEP